MASSSSPPPYIILPPTHFFKVVLYRTLEDKKMWIPESFIAKYGKFLSSSICLKLPDGLEWRVELTTATNDTVWLDNGWHRFSQHYGLSFGWFLVFRFDGNSTFHTIIMDINGSEIDYAPNPNFNHSPDDLESIASVPREVFLSPKMEPREEEGEPKERASRKRNRPYKEVDETNQSENPGFKVVIKKSFVEGRYNMTIPKEFAKKYLEKFGSIRVQNSEGRSWPMIYKWGQSRKIYHAYISSGWKSFVLQNQLKEGDIGLFKMVKKDLFLFTLEGACPPIISPQRNAAKSTAANKNPSFNVKIYQKTHKNSVVNVPWSFADNHLSPTTNTAKLVVGRKEWTVRIRQYEKCFRLSAGWSAFFWQNSLGAGDNCLFQLVQKSAFQCIFNVKIFKNPSTILILN